MNSPRKPTLDGCRVLAPLDSTPSDTAKAVDGLPHSPQDAATSDTANGRRRARERATSPRRSSAGRFRTINTFADCTLAELGRAEVAVWLLLWRDTKLDGLATAAQADLARRAGTTPRTVERAIGSLEQRGLLTVVRRGGLRRGPSTYRVHPLPVDRSPPAGTPRPRPP